MRGRLCTCVCLLVFVFFLSSCGASRVGTIPRGTPDHGNGTPAVLATATPDLSSIAPAPANTTGLTYTFVRKNQLWLAQNGAKAAQVTQFDYHTVPEVFWNMPVWSSDDHYLAFTMSAHAASLGGGGCPGPDYSANGALYVLNTATKQFTALTLPSVVQNAQVNGSPRDDYWQYIFWEDTTHLLAWYNGVTGKTSNEQGLYRYDVNTHVLTQVLPVSALNASPLANPQQGMPLLLSMRYSSGQLFYQVVVHPFEQQSQVLIYRHSVAHPEMQAQKLLAQGTEAWCMPSQSGAFVKPGWDISPDGQQLVAQVILAGNATQSVGAVQAQNLNDNSTTALFAQAPAGPLAHDLKLSWGPDSQTVVATEDQMQHGPYSASLANPSTMQQYTPDLPGQVSWRSDSGAFALQSPGAMDATGTLNIYVFLKGETHGRLLLADAREFAWG